MLGGVLERYQLVTDVVGDLDPLASGRIGKGDNTSSVDGDVVRGADPDRERERIGMDLADAGRGDALRLGRGQTIGGRQGRRALGERETWALQ